MKERMFSKLAVPSSPHRLAIGVVALRLAASTRSGATFFILLAFWSSTVNSSSWPTDPSVNLPICTAENAQNGEQNVGVPLIPDGSGGVIVAWDDLRSGVDSDVYAQRIAASGDVLWTLNGVALCTAANRQRWPKLVSDGVGLGSGEGAIVVWEDSRNGDSGGIYAQRINANGTIMWAIDGVPVCLGGYPGDVTSISDGNGGAIVAWLDQRNTPLTGADIYAQRVIQDGSVLWETNGIPICVAPDDQWEARLCPDASGGVVAVWYDDRRGNNWDIYAQRIDAEGSPLWATNGVVICNARNYQRDPVIVLDGVGGAIIAWADERSLAGTSTDIYVQRVDANGNSIWTTNGIAVCAEVGHQEEPQLVSDGHGGAIITWTDRRSDPDIYIQRIDENGNALWSVNGEAVCTAASYQWRPQLVSDGFGGAIVTWYDYRTAAQYDIYAQRVDSDGNILWNLDGVAISIAPDDQAVPQLVSDDASGAIIAWVDSRSGDADVYGQQVSAEGILGDVAPTSVPSQGVDPLTSSLTIYPNPFNPVTSIRYAVPEAGPTRLSVYDVNGHLIADLVDESRAVGVYQLEWIARGRSGTAIASGAYFVRLETRAGTATSKALVLR